MEYRLFQPIDRLTFDNKWAPRRSIADRTDIYFILSSPNRTDDRLSVECGLKLRDRHHLELKIREKRYADGQEHWVKTIRSSKLLTPQKMASIVKILENAQQHELVQRLLTATPLVVCYVDKIQGPKQATVSGRLELVGLRIQFVHATDDSALSTPLYFETVCFDQSSPSPIDTVRIQRILSADGEHSYQPVGFPEFLHTQYAAIRRS